MGISEQKILDFDGNELDIIALYKEGKTAAQITQLTPSAYTTVNRRLKQAGVQRSNRSNMKIAGASRRKPMIDADGNDVDIKALYESGMSAKAIGDVVGSSSTPILNRLSEMGVVLRGKQA